MKKAERLLKTLTLLQSRRRAVTAREIAHQFQISERTVYRDIQSLISAGVAIEGEAGVGYMLLRGEVLQPLTFDEAQLEALIFGVRMVQGWGDDALGNAASEALEKIRAILPDRLHYLNAISEETLIVPDYEREAHNPHSHRVRNAIREQQKLELEYADEKGSATKRLIRPLGLVFWGKVWTIIAWCELRADYRTFRLDRIETLRIGEEKFETTETRNLKHYLERYSDCAD